MLYIAIGLYKIEKLEHDTGEETGEEILLLTVW